MGDGMLDDSLGAELKRRVSDFVNPRNLDSFDVLCEELSTFELGGEGRVHPKTGRKIFPLVYENVLQLILVACMSEETETPGSGPNADYWKRVEKAEKAIKAAADQFDVVRDVETICYHPDELQTCRHGIVRFECEELYAQRHHVELVNQPPLSDSFPEIVARVEADNQEVLHRALTEFCPTQYRIPPHRPENLGGRVEVKWKNDLISGVVGILYGGVRMPIMKAVDYMHRILSFVFKDNIGPDAISKRWRRIKIDSPPE